jgi:hypothetical protein
MVDHLMFCEGIWFSCNFTVDCGRVMLYFSGNVCVSIFMVEKITVLLHKIHVFINIAIMVMSEIHAYTK